MVCLNEKWDRHRALRCLACELSRRHDRRAVCNTSLVPLPAAATLFKSDRLPTAIRRRHVDGRERGRRGGGSLWPSGALPKRLGEMFQKSQSRKSASHCTFRAAGSARAPTTKNGGSRTAYRENAENGKKKNRGKSGEEVSIRRGGKRDAASRTARAAAKEASTKKLPGRARRRARAGRAAGRRSRSARLTQSS